VEFTGVNYPVLPRSSSLSRLFQSFCFSSRLFTIHMSGLDAPGHLRRWWNHWKYLQLARLRTIGRKKLKGAGERFLSLPAPL
jgi:hypothetical protein